MSSPTSDTDRPADLAAGVPLERIPDNGMLAGRVGDEPVLLARRGAQLFALGASCPHYGAPLAEGLLVDDTIRCPWHHACFDLQTGAVLRAPALDGLTCWRIEQHDGLVFVREKADRPAARRSRLGAAAPRCVVIVGGGAAGAAAAETLRREGYTGRLTIFSADQDLPCDRPNLSKGYLAGTAPEASNLLRERAFYEGQGIDVKLGQKVGSLDPAARHVELSDGSRHSYDALLLATGAQPVRLDIPGAERSHVHVLRTLADSRALVDAAKRARRAVVIGASFIGLEVTAALRTRGVEVQVVTPEDVPMHKVLGAELGGYLRRLHERHGVVFHLGTKVTAIDEQSVTLATGETLPADLVVVGVGVRPALALAESAGLTLDRGVVVDAYLETSAPGVFAAGDIARWPDPLTGEGIRVEHWVVAERQGETAARNILGARERFEAAPFFWTEQYDFSCAYVGHAEGWEEAELEGLLGRDCAVTYRKDGERLAVAVVGRDLEGLKAELGFELAMQARRGAGRGPTRSPALSSIAHP